jgi:hypothetical protein
MNKFYKIFVLILFIATFYIVGGHATPKVEAGSYAISDPTACTNASHKWVAGSPNSYCIDPDPGAENACQAQLGTNTYLSCLGVNKGGTNSTSATETTGNATVDRQAGVTPTQESCSWTNPGCIILRIVGGIVLKLAGLITQLSGVALNATMMYTVIDMAKHVSTTGANVDNSWRVVRDIANMGFIFVLLYAAISTILGTGPGYQKLIVRTVVVAILVNFSLFITKVVIDIANLLALTLYSAIAPAALTSGGTFLNAGISNAFVDLLNFKSLWSPDLTANGIISVGVLGSLVLLITAFIFFAITIMFVVRYIVLILLMVVSPLAFVASILPSMEKFTNQWKETLLGQAFFAPVFFLMIWISLNILEGINSQIHPDNSWKNALGSSQPGAIGLIIVFIAFIGLLVTSLITAKNMASKGASILGKINNKALGYAGSASFGLIGATGRLTAGNIAEGAKRTPYYTRLQSNVNESGMKGWMARRQLGLIDKTRTSSFDMRGAGIGGALGVEVGKAQEGGYEKTRERTSEFFALSGSKKKKEREEMSRKANKILAVGDNQSAAERHLQLNNQIELLQAQGTAVDQSLIDERDSLQDDAGKFELSVAKASENEIAAIVESNKKLLESQAFANSLSSKQLEALNKSDKLSDGDKERLKQTRFSSISDGGIAALRIAPANRTPQQQVAAKRASTTIKGLSDYELEAIDPTDLETDEFISELRPAQAESINKSGKFTRVQKNKVRDIRKRPLMAAVNSGNPGRAAAELKKFNYKDVAGLDTNVLIDPTLLPAFTPNMLRKMAADMTPDKIQQLRDAIINMASIPGVIAPQQLQNTAAWLQDPDKGGIDFA